ncbi:YceI family protein [Flavitalea sp. BT771]|uniref:YceI family protein n=1 Tax=Flavitalea sp. BT771 TaxID=3063329 RepID=UPI0026E3844F|nr:YceI family protein [Flavitalea sp. BT771]MDO6432874.1 YceI family protein [Flavitalea sp. BT771]MDV6221850.1 YceI family protein [Flavitalea sp. BT771]
MRIITLLLGSCLICLAKAPAQDKFFTRQGHISFDATGGMEKIAANNRSVTCVLDSRTGALQLSALLKGFEFEKALMQEHFNENYVESDKYPKADFRGQLLNNNEIAYTKDGVSNLKVKGLLSIHGQTKEVTANGKITVKNGKIQATAEFDVLLSEFNITIPGLVKDKVSDHAKISVDCLLEPLKM